MTKASSVVCDQYHVSLGRVP